jgi:hypothetical protein
MIDVRIEGFCPSQKFLYLSGSGRADNPRMRSQLQKGDIRHTPVSDKLLV